ncbi:MAG: phosphoribosylaminoimidazolesuccinocarboxamide synthase [Candidatus Heimdallarchaeota archaeon]
MVDDQVKTQIKQNMQNTFLKTELTGFGEIKSNKVRDFYTKDDKIILVTSDRISAFDVILNQGIPYKGQALNQTSEYWFKTTKKIMRNHIIAVPDPNVMIAQQCTPLKLEVVLRAYITGSAWRRYKYLKENNKPLIISGVEFPDNLRKDQKLPEAVFTPTTKPDEGHDEEISQKEIVSQGLVSKDMLEQITEVAFKIFNEGTRIVKNQGGILVDTKYEFGLTPDDELVLIDEVHTADSSRYWLSNQYDELFEKGENQKGLDKEYVRNWLREHGFMGDGEIPDLPEEVVTQASLNVIKSYELITGQKFKPASKYATNARLQQNLDEYF